jgi:hypothetical protein
LIDRKKIPDPTYFELIDLLGPKKAEEFLESVKYNFRAIQNKILYESLKRRFGKRFWIYILIAVTLIAIVYEILRAKMII